MNIGDTGLAIYKEPHPWSGNTGVNKRSIVVITKTKNESSDQVRPTDYVIIDRGYKSANMFNSRFIFLKEVREL